VTGAEHANVTVVAHVPFNRPASDIRMFGGDPRSVTGARHANVSDVISVPFNCPVSDIRILDAGALRRP
jgi:hypothetical protein